MSKNDEFGARMKEYEARETARRFLPFIPVYARIDGRSFSKFTKGADKPFDASITAAMQAATCALVEQTHAKIGYVQSDEISLVWETTEPDEGMFFDGKVQKMCSVLAGIATAAFIRQLVNDPVWNAKNPTWLAKLPHFDARVIQLPSRTEAANMFLWREADARKNAITMVASSMFSHKALHGVSGRDKLKMIAEKSGETGINFEDYPVSLRRGSFMRRVTKMVELSEGIRLKIPEKNRPLAGSLVERSQVEVLDVPAFNTVTNRTEFIFNGMDPVVSD